MCSDFADWNALSVEWVVEWVGWSTGGEISDRSWGVGELVQVTHEMSLESVGLLVSDPSLVVLVEVVPCVLKVSLKVAWDGVWLKFVGGFKDSTGGELGLILHEELLSSLVARWGLSLSGVLRENVVHNFIFIGAIESRFVSFLPSIHACWKVLSFRWRVVTLPSLYLNSRC